MYKGRTFFIRRSTEDDLGFSILATAYVAAPSRRILRRALEFQEDPSWWRLCVEHVYTLDDPEYEPLVQALCMRVAPEHPYMALTQSLHASLNNVLMSPPESVHIIPGVDFQAP